MGEARQMLSTIGMVASPLPPGEPVVDATAIEEAERTLWAWYLEWSAIARQVIQDGRLLREMGFGAKRRGSSEGEGDAEETEAAAPATGDA
jgi:hypothetical protein